MNDFAEVLPLLEEHRYFTIRENELDLTYHGKLREKLASTNFPINFVQQFQENDIIENKLNNKFPKPSQKVPNEAPREEISPIECLARICQSYREQRELYDLEDTGLDTDIKYNIFIHTYVCLYMRKCLCSTRAINQTNMWSNDIGM